MLAIAEGEVSREVVVPLQHGIHARPAARIAESARKFAAEVALVAVNRRASAKSPVGVMSLAVRHGDRISVVASGLDADFAVAAIAELIEGGMGESAALPPTAAPAAVVEAVRAAPPSEPGLLRGVMAAPGLAIGQAVRFVSSRHRRDRGRRRRGARARRAGGRPGPWSAPRSRSRPARATAPARPSSAPTWPSWKTPN